MKAKLTADLVENATKPGFIWDEKLEGFALRVRPNGRKTYVVKFGRGSREKRGWMTIGEHGKPWRPDPVTGKPRNLTFDLAKREAMKIRGLIADGQDPLAQLEAEKAMPTLATFATRYLEDSKPHRSESTALQNTHKLKRDILPELGATPLDKIDVAMVTRWHLARQSTPYHANRCLALLSALLNTARKWGVLPKDHINPCADVERFKERKRERFLSEQELARVGEALATAVSAWERAEECHKALKPLPPEYKGEMRVDPAVANALRLLLFTGARAGEIARLRWDEINKDRGVAMIVRKSRGLTAQPLQLPPPALQALENTPRMGEWCFPGRYGNGHISVRAIEGAWWRIRDAAEVPDVRLHDLRHSFASVAASAGNSLVLIGAMLGHNVAATTARYAHLSNDPVKAAADAVAARIESALGRKVG